MSRVGMCAVLWCALCFAVGCGKSVPVGTYASEYGEVLEIKEVGELYALDVWGNRQLFDAGPHVSSPLELGEDGSMLALAGLKLVPTEDGVMLFSGSTALEYAPIDLTSLPEPPDESARVKESIEDAIERDLVAPIRAAGQLRCGGFGVSPLSKKHVPHVISALEAASLEGFETKRRVEQMSSVYQVEGVLRIPPHTSTREGKKCVRYQKTLMGRRCAKRAKATYEVTSPGFELPVVASAAIPRKVAPKSPTALELRFEELGEIQMSASIPVQLCQHYIRPDKKSVIQDREIEAAR